MITPTEIADRLDRLFVIERIVFEEVRGDMVARDAAMLLRKLERENEELRKKNEDTEEKLLLVISRAIGRTTTNDNYYARAQEVLRAIRESDLSLPQSKPAREP